MTHTILQFGFSYKIHSGYISILVCIDLTYFLKIEHWFWNKYPTESQWLRAVRDGLNKL